VLNGSQKFVLVNSYLTVYIKGYGMWIISYDISLTYQISDIDSNIYKGLWSHFDLLPSMRLCLQ
jgi:hypothetical protein